MEKTEGGLKASVCKKHRYHKTSSVNRMTVTQQLGFI